MIVALARQYGNEVAHLFVHFLRRHDSLRALVSQQLTVALAQAMDGYLYRAFNHAQLSPQRGLRLRPTIAYQARLEAFE
jgi:hypothetical protein